jgi:hypothetical protein
MLARRTVCVASIVLGFLGWPSPLRAQAVGTATLVLRASLAPRTSLHVSTMRLRFDVAADGHGAIATVDYRAAARTEAGRPVLLTIEPDGDLEAADGSGTTGLAVGCGGQASYLELTSGQPSLIGRWMGSGLWQGVVGCRLDRAVAPGRYSLPVKFVLSLD